MGYATPRTSPVVVEGARGLLDGRVFGWRSAAEHGGLDPSGTVSSSQALQEIIGLTDPGAPRTVVVPPGTYLVKNVRLWPNLTLILDGVTLKQGGDSPSNYNTEEAQAGIFYAAGTEEAPAENIELVGGTLIGNRGSSWSVGGDDAVQLSWVNGFRWTGGRVIEVGQDGIELKHCQDAVLRDLCFENIADAAIEFRRGRNNHVINAVCRMVKHAIDTKPDTHEVTVLDIDAQTFGHAMRWHGKGWTVRGGVLDSVTSPAGLDGANDRAIWIAGHPEVESEDDECSGHLIHGVTIKNRNGGSSGRGIFFGTAYSEVHLNVKIIGVRFNNCRTPVEGVVDDLSVVDVDVRGGIAGVGLKLDGDNAIVRGGHIDATGANHGIQVIGNDANIQGVRVFGATFDGVNITSSANRTVVIGNNLTGNTRDPVRDSGTASVLANNVTTVA